MDRIKQTGRQAGQALIECLVAALALLPLFLLVPMVGKYLDIRHATIAASRKLAFECTVRYDDCARLDDNPSFADEIRMRFYSENSREVLSNDRPARDEIESDGANPLWLDRRGRSLLEKYSDVGVRADSKTLNTGFIGSLLGFGPDKFGLALDHGVYDARVQVKLSPKLGGESFTSQLDSLALEMQSHTAILTNAWSAKGPGAKSDRCHPERDTVVGRVSSPTLCGVIKTADDAVYRPVLDVIIPVVLPVESNAGDFNFHDFMDARWADRVPVSDSVHFPRLH